MAQWYFSSNGQQEGPVSVEELTSMAQSGRVGPATLVWTQGMTQWLSFSAAQSSGAFLRPGFTAPQYTYVAAPPTSSYAVISLVCGIQSFITCVVPLGIPAVICGHLALKDISNASLPKLGRGMAFAGLTLGYLSSLIMLTFVGIFVFAVIQA